MTHAGFGAFRAVLTQNGGELWYTCNRNISRNDPQKEETQMKRKDLARRATSAALAACMMFTLSAPALAESTDALMQLSIGSYRSSSLLSEENSVTLPDITVGSTKVTEDNYQNILGDNTLSYDTKTKTLKSDGTIHRDLTIDAPGVNIELCNTSSNPVVFAKLTVTNAQDVKVTSPYGLAVFGAVEISCTGEVEITSGESYAVTGNVTVKQASKVAISGKSNTDHIVTGDVTIECPVPVTIQNKGMGGMANSINYSGGKYVYSDTKDGMTVDPSSTPINAEANAVYITPVALHALTVKNGTTTVSGSTSTTNKKNQTTTYAEVAKDDVVEIEGMNFDSAKKAFDQWKVESGDAKISDPYSEKTTLTVTGEGEVTVKASYMTPRKVNVINENGEVTGTATGKTEHGTDNIFAGDTVEVSADTIPGKLFDHWECPPELTDESGTPLTEDAKKNSKVTFKMPKGDVTLTAVYKEAKTLTLKHGKIVSVTRGGALVPVKDNMELFEGDVVEITPNNRLSEKRLFDRWVVKSGKVTLNGIKTATFTMPDEPVELEAVYNNLYTATVNDGTTTRTNNHIAGDTVTVQANVPAGEKFTGWKVENNTALSLNNQSIDLTQREITFNMPSTDITLTAEHKTKRSVIVNNRLAASGLIEGESVTVHAADYDVSVDKFDHWESNVLKLSDADRTNPRLTFTMPDSDVVLRAVEKETYKVVVNNGKANGSSTVDAKPGKEVTITAKGDTEDEVFVGWNVDSGNVTLKDSKKSTTSFIMPHEAVELTAQHETRFTVTVNYQTDGGAATEDASQRQRAIFGTPITVKAADRTSEGLEFDHWEITNGIALKDNEAEEITFDMVRSNVTVTAIYKTLNTISVHDGKAEVKGKEVNKAKEGDKVTITAKKQLDEMKRFDHWTVRDNNVTLANKDDAATTFVMGKEAVDLTAEYVDLFKLDVINGSATLTYKGTTYAADGTAAEGDVIKATADPVKDNEHFTGWTSNVTLTKDNVALTEDELKNPDITFDMPKGDVELKANYSYVYDQTVTVVNGTAYTDDNTTPAAAITVTPGKTVYIKPDDRRTEDLVFTEWEVTGGTGVTLDYDPDSFTMPQSNVPVEITAQYAKLHAVTVKDGTAKHENGDDLLIMNDGRHGALEGNRITITAKDKSDEGKVFERWEVTGDKVTPNPVNDDGSVATFEMPTFEMPDEAVVITAVYKNVHTVTVHSEDSTNIFENIKEGTAYKVTAPEISGMRFSHWVVNFGDVTDLVTDLAERTGTFTMPNGNVDLTAEYVHLYGLTVTYGTAVNANGDADSAAKGDRITVTADKPYPTETFEGWKLLEGTITEITDKDGNVLNVSVNEDGYLVDENGEKILNTPFTFTMPDGNVKLKANYSMPAYVMAQPVTVEGGTAFAEGEAAAAEIIVDPGKRITVIADPNADSNMIFDYWEVTSLDEDGKATVKLEDATSMTTSFTMPMAPVELTAHWRTIDEAPSSGGDGGAGAAIAGVAIGGAAVWGGYEIATRVILNDLLPAGAAIPANRGQLALLIWTEKGKPEPAAQPAFADITDAELAKAAQWCVEQGLLDAREGKFESDGWMPKFKTIEIWNKAFPKK